MAGIGFPGSRCLPLVGATLDFQADLELLLNFLALRLRDLVDDFLFEALLVSGPRILDLTVEGIVAVLFVSLHSQRVVN